MALTLTGYTKPTYDEIVTRMKNAVWSSPFGKGANLESSSAMGQIVSICAKELANAVEDIEDVYNSRNPANASGIPLDNICEATGTKRKAATKGTGALTVYGTLGTAIAIGDLTVSVLGNSSASFINTTAGTIGAGTNAVQLISFTDVPDAGQWALVYNGEITSVLNYNDVAATVEAALNALASLSGVTVSGDYTSGFTVTFSGDDGSKPQDLLRYDTNTLEFSGDSVTISVSETTAGVLPNVTLDIEAVTAGSFPAYATTITVIETPLSGVDSCSNASDITQGTDIESDAALRLRRNQELANPGKSTVDAIRAKLLPLDDVTAARVYENDTDVTDAFGRPPSSLHALVIGGDEQEIIDVIGDDKPAGTQTFGSIDGTYTTGQGQEITLHFDRPTEVPIYIEITVTTDPDTFPADGADSIKQALADYGDATFSIGDDVIFYKLYKPIEDIVGIISVDMFIGISDPATSQNNIDISDIEVSVFDTTTISVTVV